MIFQWSLFIHFFSKLERTASQSTMQVQLAPSIEHQSAAMLSILERYKWHQFSIVTSQIAGHDDFVQAVRERVNEMQVNNSINFNVLSWSWLRIIYFFRFTQEHFKFTILNSVIVTRSSDLMELVNSEARVMLLYCTKGEAVDILAAAEELKITGKIQIFINTIIT